MTSIDPGSLPRHLAIIMDGNGRWANARGLPRIAGHRKGAIAVRTTVTACRKIGIKVLTLYSFSAQNWSRPKTEVSGLMGLLSEYMKSEKSTILENGIKFTAIGELERLPSKVKQMLDELIEVSAGNSDMTLCLALSYGGREEIAAMTKAVSNKVLNGELDPKKIDVDVIDQNLWSSQLGPVDLMIRTSGELRISNYLLWSAAYSELYFSDKMWPEFDEITLHDALLAYSKRHRRFGAVK